MRAIEAIEEAKAQGEKVDKARLDKLQRRKEIEKNLAEVAKDPRRGVAGLAIHFHFPPKKMDFHFPPKKMENEIESRKSIFHFQFLSKTARSLTIT